MALKLKGSTSGFVALDAPSVSGNNTLILPENNGSAQQLLGNDITAGVTTFTSVTVNRNGDLTVPGTISIGGTLTYEDVTSVDSIGIVTARGLSIFGNTSGLNVPSGISTFSDLSIRNVTGVGATFSLIRVGKTGGQGKGLEIYQASDAALRIQNSTTGTGSNDGILFEANQSDALLLNYESGYLSFGTAGTERIRILANGLVGIGITNPSRHFEVNSNSSNTFIRIKSSDTGNAGLEFGDQSDTVQGAIFQNSSDNSIRFNGYNNAERLRILSDGDIGIGTDTVHNNARLQVSTNQQVVAMFEGTGVSDPQIYLGDNMASPTDNCIVIGYDKADNRGYLTVGGDGDNVFTITNGGAIGINNTAPVEKLGISGNMRFINPNDNTSRISALYSGSYNLGSSGGSAIAFHRVTDGVGGSDEIAFETHWQGNRHGEAARFNKYGNLAFPTNQGIDFSADGSAAGMNSELLHDYEEGTWTPIVQWSSGTGAAGGGNAGFYVKIGCFVAVYATVNWTSVSGATVSYARINGLPFVYRNLSNYRSTSLIGGQVVGVEGGASYNIALGTDANNDFLYITPVNGAQTAGGGNYSHFPTIKSSGTIYGLAVTYMTSA